ncbi:MAG: hypothetical protein V4476_23005 [Pseudomonadota bacterium]
METPRAQRLDDSENVSARTWARHSFASNRNEENLCGRRAALRDYAASQQVHGFDFVERERPLPDELQQLSLAGIVTEIIEVLSIACYVINISSLLRKLLPCMTSVFMFPRQSTWINQMHIFKFARARTQVQA